MEQDSSTTLTSSTDGAATRPDNRQASRSSPAGRRHASAEATLSRDGEGGSRQGDEAGSRDPDGWISTAMQEPSLAGVAGGAGGAASEAPARAAFELSVAVLLERAKLMFLSSRAPVSVREPRLCEEPTTFELLVLAQTVIAEPKTLCPALFSLDRTGGE